MNIEHLAVNHLLERMREIEESVLNSPPPDYVMFMTVVGQYREVKRLLTTITEAMKGIEDEDF